MKGKKYTINDVRSMAAQKGFRFISSSFRKVTDKCDWKCCKCGYQWIAQIRKIKDYKGCPRCLGRIYIREDVVHFAKKKNICLLSKRYSILNKRYKWKCNTCSHIWLATANGIVHTSGCPRCSKCAPYTIKELKQIAKHKNLKLLSNVYKGVAEKYPCRCLKCDHVWSTWIRAGARCPKCSMANRIRPLIGTIDDARQIGQNKNFELMSNVFLGMKKKHTWKCHEGHIWESTVQNIRRGTHCPTCSKKLRSGTFKFVTENKVRMIFEELTGECFPSDWHTLRNGQQLDGYCENLKMAFEYQGPQHYCVDGYWNKTITDLNGQQIRDNRKTQRCQQLKITKIDVPYTVAKPIKRLRDFIQQELNVYTSN